MRGRGRRRPRPSSPSPCSCSSLALLDQGFPLARLDLNDGGVWLTATSKLQLGRYNAQVEELNGGLAASGSTFDVLQDAGDVLLVEPGSVVGRRPGARHARPRRSPCRARRVDGGGRRRRGRRRRATSGCARSRAWTRCGSPTDTPDVELGEGGARRGRAQRCRPRGRARGRRRDPGRPRGRCAARPTPLGDARRRPGRRAHRGRRRAGRACPAAPSAPWPATVDARTATT